METIKTEPDRLIVTNETLQTLIRTAYKIEDDQFTGAPTWLGSERYDIEAKVGRSAADEQREASSDQSELENSRMLQALLSDRFKLAVHRETKQIPVYTLVLAGDGPNLQESAPAYEDSNDRMIRIERGRITGREVPIATLARILSDEVGRPVLDKTGLLDHYDVTLQWQASPESSRSRCLCRAAGAAQHKAGAATNLERVSCHRSHRNTFGRLATNRHAPPFAPLRRNVVFARG